ETALQRRFESMPRQRCAFDPHREGLDAGQRFEPFDIFFQGFWRYAGLAAGHPRMELRKQRARLRDGLALQDLGHQGGRGGRNRAAAPLEADIGDAVALDREINRDPVAAQRVVAARQMRWMFESAEIARVAPVIEDDVLVELAQIRSGIAHRTNISRQASTAFARRSISASSL